MPTVFFSYSHADEDLRDQLEKQLAMLKRQGVIETWHDRRIGAGQELGQVIDEHINTDDIILLLVSQDFISSDYCYNIEMKQALERHEAGEAIVIPVILRACEWPYAPFGKLMATPTDGKPVTQWPDRDEAFLQVARAVRDAAGRLSGGKAPALVGPSPSKASITEGDVTSSRPGPRSSNLRLSKSFTQRDKDQFKADTFEYIARYFENSLAELEARNPGYQGTFRRVDANRFFATIYKDGKDVARATVYLGGMLGAINYLQGETTSSNSSNESLSVDADDQMLFLTSMGMSSFGRAREQKLTQEGAAELLWGLVIDPLQQRHNW
ncbi:toll/interleukin-1 receptor domain-containing protein [Pseudoxanthomonas sp. 3HH-4]|uniref:toll/interleukin-1 receptor domain-containing protein n=1 Tax=Pseudoxanthomonas sp. 3HH-4 TaxID=1690214 RepID=UPI00114D6C88|nr:toll/interleukin-1 receptor domain-containing protein [Pseudoxanthomonas sp. 3HH-4]